MCHTISRDPRQDHLVAAILLSLKNYLPLPLFCLFTLALLLFVAKSKAKPT